MHANAARCASNAALYWRAKRRCAVKAPLDPRGATPVKQPQGDILIVDDDPGMRRLLCMRLEAEGYAVRAAEDGEQALAEASRQRPDLVISDLRMAPVDGMDLLARLHERLPGLPVIMMTAYGTIPDAVQATRLGAYGFLTKPVDKARLLEGVEEVMATHRQRPGPQAHADGAAADGARDLITRSAHMREVLAEARMVAKAESSVLIQGESGTGKELLARYVHQRSRRAEAAFVAVNCSAIPADLLESELFGHAKGAFTGASRDHAGLFRMAEGGTLFLDEIGDMPTSLQAKLLRALEERRVRPVGATQEVAVDVRVVSATHRNLHKAIADGAFREDLYYRLNVVTLELPPLRERREDIPLLASHFLKNLAGEDAPKTYAPEAMRLLVAGDWPGNIRQLQNVVESNVALSPARVISQRQVEKAISDMPRSLPGYNQARADFTRDYLAQLLRICNGNVSQAARLAERNRTDMYKLLNKHRLDAADFKQADP